MKAPVKDKWAIIKKNLTKLLYYGVGMWYDTKAYKKWRDVT
jgi:hypothetical protein